MSRGEVWWAELPHRKRRPYLVLTYQAAIPVLTSIVTVALTRTRLVLACIASRFPARLAGQKGERYTGAMTVLGAAGESHVDETR